MILIHHTGLWLVASVVNTRIALTSCRRIMKPRIYSISYSGLVYHILCLVWSYLICIALVLPALVSKWVQVIKISFQMLWNMNKQFNKMKYPMVATHTADWNRKAQWEQTGWALWSNCLYKNDYLQRHPFRKLKQICKQIQSHTWPATVEIQVHGLDVSNLLKLQSYMKATS